MPKTETQNVIEKLLGIEIDTLIANGVGLLSHPVFGGVFRKTEDGLNLDDLQGKDHAFLIKVNEIIAPLVSLPLASVVEDVTENSELSRIVWEDTFVSHEVYVEMTNQGNAPRVYLTTDHDFVKLIASNFENGRSETALIVPGASTSDEPGAAGVFTALSAHIAPEVTPEAESAPEDFDGECVHPEFFMHGPDFEIAAFLTEDGGSVTISLQDADIIQEVAEEFTRRYIKAMNKKEWLPEIVGGHACVDGGIHLEFDGGIQSDTFAELVKILDKSFFDH